MHDTIRKRLRVVHYAGIAIVTLLLAGATALGVVPLYRRGAESIAAARQRHVALARFNGLDERIAQVEQDCRQTEERLRLAEERLPGSLEASRFNSELTEVARDAGIRIEAVPKPDAPREIGRYMALPVTIIGTGEWESCFRFLNGIRGMNRLARLDTAEMQIVKDDQAAPSDRPLCRITVRFSTFFMER